MSIIQISGQWVAGPNAGERATLCEVRAGRVFGLLADGTRVLGSPDDFISETGETGEILLKFLLPNPRASTLLHGTVREALAAACSVAMLGQQETRAWDQDYTYVIDDGEGNCGVVMFDRSGVVGALYMHDAKRNFDVDHAVSLAPAEQQEMLHSLVVLPILQHDGNRSITSVFWTEGGLLHAAEAWHKVYRFGGELLRHELMEDREWRAEATEYYAFSESLIDSIIRFTNRLDPLTPIFLTNEELSKIIPQDAPFRAIALEQLFSGGVVKTA
jgi:hypothetical protein